MSRCRICSFIALLSLSFLIGCSSQRSTLVVKSDQKKVAYAQTFSQCYAGKSADGSDQFVLVTDDMHETHCDKMPPEHLEPVTQKPLHQIVCLKVLWRPMSGAESNIGANAAIDWYVLSDTVTGDGDLLEYHGSAYVTVTSDDDVTKVQIHEGSIKPAAVRGSLSDPVGPAKIEGRFVAINDPARAAEILTNAHARTAAATVAP